MAHEEPFRLTTGPRPLDGILTLPEGSGHAPVVVLCHGFKGFMEWAFLPPLAALLAERGLAVVRFDFAGSGMRPGEDRVSDLDAFRDATIAHELEDLETVLVALERVLGAGRIDCRRLALFGHSRGGAVALLTAARERWSESVRALVTWAAVATLDRWNDEEKLRWRATGTLTITNSRTGQELPLGTALLDDVERHRDAYDLSAAAARRRAPWLLLHGTEDATVPLAEAETLAATAARPAELAQVAGANHAFCVRHPFRTPNPALTDALERTQRWLLRWLRGS